MTRIDDIFVTQGDDDTPARFNGSWYRGEHTNFIPSKKNLEEPDAIEKYVLDGWLPPNPFISQKYKITAFGSCFAFHTSKYLYEKGYSVLVEELDLHAHIIRFGEGMVNTFAILQQLEWALEDKPMPENLWFGPEKEIAVVDDTIKEHTKQLIQETDTFIITLGLSEIWYDKKSGEAFWRAIPAQYFDPDRHDFRISSVEENKSNLEKITRLIRKARPEAPIIYTLSPVPLMATFRPVSCVTASSVSKAILRVAVDEFMRSNENDGQLFYFPSYEIVKEFFPDPYAEDNRHIKPEIVATVMQTFERHFCYE